VLKQIQLLGAPLHLKFGMAKNVQKRCDLRQLSNLTANLSELDRDIDKR